VRYPRISLDDAVVVVTGGARGIGRSTGDLFADAGATAAWATSTAATPMST
jgi:NAD(P)-dependent dehydrogenase (short-subunit alcohol dehydrogenase family)